MTTHIEMIFTDLENNYAMAYIRYLSDAPGTRKTPPTGHTVQGNAKRARAIRKECKRLMSK